MRTTEWTVKSSWSSGTWLQSTQNQTVEVRSIKDHTNLHCVTAIPQWSQCRHAESNVRTRKSLSPLDPLLWAVMLAPPSSINISFLTLSPVQEKIRMCWHWGEYPRKWHQMTCEFKLTGQKISPCLSSTCEQKNQHKWTTKARQNQIIQEESLQRTIINSFRQIK